MKQYGILVLLICIFFKSNAQQAQRLTITYGEIFRVVSFTKQRNIEEYDRKHYLYINGDSLGFCSFQMQKPNKNNNTVGSKKDHHAVFVFPLLNRYLAENSWTKPYNLSEYSFTDFNWQLNTDSMLIAGYLCKAAVSDGIVAWFTNEIPVSFGPAYYQGLPGLILMIEDHRAKRLYKAISVKKDGPEIVLPDFPLKACSNCESKLGQIEGYFKR